MTIPKDGKSSSNTVGIVTNSATIPLRRHTHTFLTNPFLRADNNAREWCHGGTMKSLLISTILCATASAALAGGSVQCQSYSALTSELDSKSFNFAIQYLRDQGPKGFAEMMALYRENKKPELEKRWRLILDKVSRQKDSAKSGLYWHTDIEKAKEVAGKENKPILTLRLLGNLDEELSCANSRFFRTLLYPDPKVSAFLRDHYVLHWKSVRPVPKITVDFGDGRKLERTITGNSIHYVIDAEGRVVDALPGLYEADAFLNFVQRAAKFVEVYADAPSKEWENAFAAWHKHQVATLDKQFNELIGKIGVDQSKAQTRKKLAMDVLTDKQWTKLAALKAKTLRIDPVVQAIIAEKAGDRPILPAPNARAANALSRSKSFTEDQLIDMVALERRWKKLQNLRQTLAFDTVRNEYTLHRRIHERLAASGMLVEPVDLLNEWVYAELFKTPGSDPWLGLRAEEYFSAIENDGAVGSAN